MNKKNRPMWNCDVAETSVAVSCQARDKRALNSRTLTRVALAVVAGGALSTAQAGGHILGIEGLMQSGDGANRVWDAPQTVANVPLPQPITGVRGFF